ncbi:hypothetical protein E2C01_033093 [Portunus trituberculatus]|uniref:Uncharacterized protein n=1 Tax=Portunus trituberculatus TaxID=210409 RepID=A0A5B7F395_PORTR|nr:hypothetical protein [Portunus trituberculatus]
MGKTGWVISRRPRSNDEEEYDVIAHINQRNVSITVILGHCCAGEKFAHAQQCEDGLRVCRGQSLVKQTPGRYLHCV